MQDHVSVCSTRTQSVRNETEHNFNLALIMFIKPLIALFMSPSKLFNTLFYTLAGGASIRLIPPLVAKYQLFLLDISENMHYFAFITINFNN